MTSRRPMTRTFSGNGRSNSLNEEDSAPSSRPDGRNYLSNVRPENSYSHHRYSHYRPSRSTFCTVMSQLTEETQPCFETTIKSKAVSESCNVKFSCVVTGYPAPELTWYKDDMELDRYCGLPKYEIFRNGKTHTLHIYNCTLDDAAIYQASARNSKGIVSCSSVLEVGDMSEYKIHQRFFDKLKQKAEVKRRELEESRRREKENREQEHLSILHQDRIMRKRRTPGGADSLNSSDSAQEAEETAEETTEAAVEIPSEVTNAEAMETAITVTSDTVQENGNQEANHVADMVEIVHTKPLGKEKLAKKKIRISNGFDEGVVTSGQKDEKPVGDENISLAQYLSESVQSQAVEEKQSPVLVQQHMEVDIAGQQEKEKEFERENEREREKERQRQKDREREKENELLRKEEEQRHKKKEREKAQDMERAKQLAEAKKTARKSESKQSNKKSNSESQPKSAITSVLTSLKDIFFGKSKTKSIDAPEETQSGAKTSWETDFPPAPPEPYPYCPPMHSEPPNTTTECHHVAAEQTKAMEVEEQAEEDIAEGSRSPQLPRSLRSVDKHGVAGANTDELSPAPHRPPEVSTETYFVEVPESVEEVSVGLKEEPAPPAPPPPLPQTQIQWEAMDDHVQSGGFESPVQEENASAIQALQPGEVVFCTEPVTGDDGGALSLQATGPSLGDQVTLNLESTDSHGSPADLPVTEAPEEELRVDEGVEVECDIVPQQQDAHSVSGETPEQGEYKEFLRESGSEISTVMKEEESTLAEGSIEEREEKSIEESESEKMLQVENTLEKRTHVYQEIALGVSSVNSNLGLGLENVEEMVGVSSAELNKDESREWVSDNQKVDSSATDKTVEIEEMETEVIIEQLEEVQHKGKDYQVRAPVIVLPASEPQTEAEEEKNVLSLSNKDTKAQISVEPPSHNSVTAIEVCCCPLRQIPEIRVTINEEQPVNMPSINILITEPEEPEPVVSIRHRLSELQEDAIELSDQMIVDPSTTVGSAPAGISATPGGMCVGEIPEDILLPVKDTQEVVQQHASEKINLDKEPEPAKTSRQLDSSSIPVINVAETGVMPRSHEDNAVAVKIASITAPQQEAHKRPPVMPPPTAITCVDGSQEIMKDDKQDDEMKSLAAILWGVKHNIDEERNEVTPHKGFKAKEQPLTDNLSALPPKIPLPAETEPSLRANTPQISISATDKMGAPTEADMGADRPKKDRAAVEKLGVTTPLSPLMSPSTLRRLMAKGLFGPDSPLGTSIPAITVDPERRGEENSGGSTPTSVLSCESSPKMRRKDSPSPIPSATPEELASGARRKIFLSKARAEEADGAVSPDAQGKRDLPYMSPSQARRTAYLQAHPGQQTPPMEKRSPLLSRRKATLEVPKVQETPEETEPPKTEARPADRPDPFKAPQVIRKIRGEPFSDATGHLKLWCQFFNVLSDSTITWSRDEVELLEVKRSAGDESQVALAIVQASSKDCGVYACTIKNEYGNDTTDLLLSSDILAEYVLRDELEVGEEIEMTPLLFTKGLADTGCWGDKFFGRIMTEEVHLGEGIAHKACRVKVIYGLDPIFESGSTCITKVRNFIAYGTKEESHLIERNLQITKQLCRMQNVLREYCKIFAAEARVIENFGHALEVNPVYLVYRPANTVPYATVEAELKGTYVRYCFMDGSGRLVTRTSSEVEQKCSTFQHWIHQWTNGNLVVTQLEGVDMKVTNIRIAAKTKGYQGLTEDCAPKVLEQFLSHHQCNYYCGLMGLRPLKPMDFLQQPTKAKGSRSPLLNRKAGGTGSSSPQLQRKVAGSPQTTRKAASSPKVTRKADEVGDGTAADTKHKTVEIPKVVRMR
ncbi:hypothetical protein ACEWY4_010323 [Coilia grayii]|uniref:non-specific serine/threonine protein kinase n=1 Tax=Coilia grayii TaxID=363190 RepID=A0ABD1K1J9_9TELE